MSKGPLTPREVETLALNAGGACSHEIVQGPVETEGTVKGHANRVLDALVAHNRTRSAARAGELQLLGLLPGTRHCRGAWNFANCSSTSNGRCLIGPS